MSTIPTQTLVLYFVAGTLGFAVITMLVAAFFINNKTFAGLFISKKTHKKPPEVQAISVADEKILP